jgi:hypothetical protein
VTRETQADQTTKWEECPISVNRRSVALQDDQICRSLHTLQTSDTDLPSAEEAVAAIQDTALPMLMIESWGKDGPSRQSTGYNRPGLSYLAASVTNTRNERRAATGAAASARMVQTNRWLNTEGREIDCHLIWFLFEQ